VTILAVSGLLRESRIARGTGVTTVAGGGHAGGLARKIEAALTEEIHGIISIGIAGALAPNLCVGDCIIASEVVAPGERVTADEPWTAALHDRIAGARLGLLAGANRIAATPEAKAALHRETGALAVDMESHIAARVARDHGLAFTALRVISDDAGTVLPPAALVAMKPNGGLAIGKVLQSLLMHPQQIPQLLRTARDSEAAFAGLLRRRGLAGALFAFPNLG
jgi:hopanoid-associated phosphorylase